MEAIVKDLRRLPVLFSGREWKWPGADPIETSCQTASWTHGTCKHSLTYSLIDVHFCAATFIHQQTFLSISEVCHTLLRLAALKTSHMLTQGDLRSQPVLKFLDFLRCNKPTCHRNQVWLIHVFSKVEKYDLK